ncbi:MAG: hypothetical protein PHN90_01070, partial [Methanothrix sp.]|nr:hypothetical protein [Methanothrix sp.]
GISGIFIRWDGSSNAGDGLVLGGNSSSSSSSTNETASWPEWATKLNGALLRMDSADTPENYVTTIKEFHLESREELQALQSAGVHPLKVLGVM